VVGRIVRPFAPGSAPPLRFRSGREY
jgi:hypothetical protein